MAGNVNGIPLKNWHAAVAELHDEVATLLDCLSSSGVLQMDTFSARLHRRRFATAKRLHPSTWLSSLSAVLEPAGVVLPAAGFALPMVGFVGVSTARALQSTSQGFAHAVGAALGILGDTFHKVYVCGGFDGQQALDSAERFDPAVKAWEVLPPMMQRRRDAAAAVALGRLYVCGGHDGQKLLTSAERFDPITGIWEALPPMERWRRIAAAVVLGGRVYVCGGHDGVQPLRLVERFNPKLGRWEQLPPMAERRGFPTAAVLSGRLYVCGGHDGHQALDSAECFHPTEEEWDALPSMAHRRGWAVSAVVAERLYICGGHDGQRALSSVERFDPTTLAWEALPPMMHRRGFAAAAVVAGRLYICGGHDGQQALNSSERFTPLTGTWEELLPMSQRRWGAVAAAFSGVLDEIYTCSEELATFVLWDEDGAAAEVVAPVTSTIEQLLRLALRKPDIHVEIRTGACALALHPVMVGLEEEVPLNCTVPLHMFVDVKEAYKASAIAVRGVRFGGLCCDVERRVAHAILLLDELNLIISSEEFQEEIRAQGDPRCTDDMIISAHHQVLSRHGLEDILVMQSRIGLVLCGSREVEERSQILAQLAYGG